MNEREKKYDDDDVGNDDDNDKLCLDDKLELMDQE